MPTASKSKTRVEPFRHHGEHARRYVTITEASEYTGLSPRTLRTYISDGRLTGYRLGPRALRLDMTELDGLFVPIPTAAFGGGAR